MPDDDDGYSPDPAADLWHNPEIDKADPYVGELLQTHLRQMQVDLKGAHLAGIHLEQADLAGLDLTGADLRDAKLAGVDLSGARLQAAILRRANLQGADLRNADLQGSDLTRAHLGNAQLAGANLANARIEETILLGTDLSEADLSGADIGSFTWNRLTRFSGITGFDPDTAGEGGDDLATARYAAPLALGDHDISHSRRSSVSGSDPALSQTHVYRAPGLGSSAARSTASEPGVTSAPPPAETVAPEAGEAPPAAPPADRSVWWPVLVAALALLAVGGWWLAVDGRLARPQAPPSPGPIVDGPSDRTDAGELQAELRSYRSRMASLTARIDTLDQQNRNLQAHLGQSQADLREVQLQNRWLRTRHDETTDLRDRAQACETALHEQRVHNQRLEDTATILAEGVTRLRSENESIKSEVYTQVQNIARLEDLTAEVEKLQRQLTAREEHLEALQLRNDQLERDLVEADGALAGIHRRIQGTALEDLLADDHAEAPLVSIARGRTVTFGGDYLLTLTVDEGELPGTVNTRLVLQAPPDDHIPEMNLILYGAGGKPIRKLAVSFPDNRHTGGFASLDATVSSEQFPTAARLVLAPGLQAPALLGKADSDRPGRQAD